MLLAWAACSPVEAAVLITASSCLIVSLVVPEQVWDNTQESHQFGSLYFMPIK